jgi:membrane fusion protein, multidrug efflux system
MRVVVAVAAMSLAALVGGAVLPGCKKPEGQPKVQVEEPPIRLAPEDVVVVQRDKFQTGPRISGTLEARQRSVVRAEAAGAVVAIGPELGQTVRKGDLLARIEAKALGDVTSSARSGVSAAEAARDLARREVERTEALVKGGAIAQRELDRVQSQLKQAEAAVNQARAQLASSQSQLGDATVRSPLAGVVARRTVNAGDVVSPGAELYEVIDPSTMRLDASVSSDDLASIAPGKAVDFEVRGYPGQRFAGTISRVAPAADPVTRQIQVLVDIPNPGGKLVAGLYAEGRIAVEEREGLVAPMAAIDMSGDQPSVLRIKNGVVERSVVGLGVRDERAEIVEVVNGLAPGDTLLLARALKNVVPGAKVSIEGAKAAGTGSAAPPAPAPTAPAVAPALAGSATPPPPAAKPAAAAEKK